MVHYNFAVSDDPTIKRYADEFTNSMILIFEKEKIDLENRLIENALKRMKNVGITTLTLSDMPSIQLNEYLNLELKDPKSVNLQLFEKYISKKEYESWFELQNALETLYSTQ